MPVVNFLPIPVEGFPELPPKIENNLSSDAKYLHQIYLLVTTGKVSLKLLKRVIGKLCHSRWLTLTSIIVRIYISLHSDNDLYDNVVLLVRYILTVYWTMHITVKRQSSILDGPKLLFKEIQLVKSLNMRSDLCMIVLQSVQQNCSFSHPENVLLTMLEDFDKNNQKQSC